MLKLFPLLLAALVAEAPGQAELANLPRYNQSMAWHCSLPTTAKADSIEDPQRISELSATEVLGVLEVQEGMTVLDVGAGTGLFTVAMGRAVGPKGRVYASDVDPAMLDKVRGRFSGEGLQNLGAIRISFGGQLDNPYSGIQVDRVLMNSVVEVVPSPDRTLAQVAEVMKPGARLVVVHPRLYQDFSPATALPCQQILERAREGGQANPMAVALQRAGLDLASKDACELGTLAGALNALIADRALDPKPFLPAVATAEGRGVLRAALLQEGASAGAPRAGVQRIMSWYAVVSYFGLEGWAWKNALGRGLYPSREVLVALAARHGLVLEEGRLASPSYWVLSFRKAPEVVP